MSAAANQYPSVKTPGALVVGGGFYGVAIAVYLATVRRLSNVMLVEQCPELMTHASFSNQARVHNGYHYPRSFVTAYRSRVNFPRFVRDWEGAIRADFTKLYAVARHNSKVSARQFQRFCEQIGAELRPASAEYRSLFNRALIEDVFEVREYAFNAAALASWGRDALESAKVSVRLNTRVEDVLPAEIGGLTAVLENDGHRSSVTTPLVFNCTYSGVGHLSKACHGLHDRLKHEITEITLVEPPSILKDIGITVMDGAYFSFMPFPARALHSLTHVRYTPHLSWKGSESIDPYVTLGAYDKTSRFERMRRDAARYMPAIRDVKHRDSLFEVKTVLQRNEADDGRPILLDRSVDLPGFYSVLGGKIDNIYDVLEKLDQEAL